jgi:hypothetical protein
VIWPWKTGRSLLNILFLAKWVGPDAEIESLNLTGGERKPWTRFSPADKTAVAGITKIRITSDGIHYAYELQRIYSTPFLADGLP